MVFGVAFGVFFASLALLLFVGSDAKLPLDKFDWIYVGFLGFCLFTSLMVMILMLVIPYLLVIVR